MVSASDCGFVGNSDVYGFGVRLGTYLQWLSSIIAPNLSREEADAANGMNACYQFAMLAGTIWMTQHHDLLALESFLALLFCFGGVCLSSIQGVKLAWPSSRQQSTTADSNEYSVAALASLSLQVAVVGYGIWLVFVGLDKLGRTPQNCPEKAFFFCAVPLFGWYRTFLKVIFICSACVLAIWLLLQAGWLFRSCVEWLETWADVPETDAEVDIAPRPFLSSSLAIGILGLGVFVTAIELTLHWNDVKEVYSAGSFSQLFPLLVGVSSFLRLGYKVGVAVWRGDVRLSPV